MQGMGKIDWDIPMHFNAERMRLEVTRETLLDWSKDMIETVLAAGWERDEEHGVLYRPKDK